MNKKNNNKGPDFLIIGVQKGGTVSAVVNLNKHPDVFVHTEIHYFDNLWNIMPKQWYYDMFMKSNKLVKGEKNPELIYIDDCAKRIKKVCPKTKFILLLRDPIKRAYSGWNMNVNEKKETRSFKECIENNIATANLDEPRTPYNAIYQYVQRGFYMDQIERFMKVFPNRDNILIIISELFKKNPQFYYEQIFKFLGVRSVTFPVEESHIGSYSEEIDSDSKKILKKIYKKHNQRLFDFLGYSVPEWNN